MKVNVKLSLDDDTRRALASYMAGKPVKRLATRADVNALVLELLATATTMPVRAGQTVRTAGPVELNRIPDTRPAEALATRDPDPDPEAGEFCGDDCCRRNHLLQARVNVLQHRLDTRR